MITRFLGLCLLLLAALVFLVAVIGLLDPAGTKMADDSDPFGPPDPRYIDATMMVASAGLSGAGFWLLVRRIKRAGRRPDSRQQPTAPSETFQNDRAQFADTRKAVAEGLEQAERGESRPAEDVLRDLRGKHGLPL